MFVKSVGNRNDTKNSSAARINGVKYIAHMSKIPSWFPKQVNFSSCAQYMKMWTVPWRLFEDVLF